MATNSSAKQFKLDLDKAFEEDVEQVVVAVSMKIAMEALNRVVLKSPVKSGRFRGNWTVAFGQQDLTTTTEVDPSGMKTIAKGSQIILGQKGPAIIWLSNNLPYAERLENGYSKQAPAGMVAITFTELSKIVEVKV